MKRRALAFADRAALRAFLLVLGYWKWRTGKPAIVVMHSPELARDMYPKETMH